MQEGENGLTKSDEVTAVLTGPRIKAFFRKLFGGEPLTFDYKWCVAHELHLHTSVAQAAPRDVHHQSNVCCFVQFETRTHKRTHASTTPSHLLHATVRCISLFIALTLTLTLFLSHHGLARDRLR